ncbi:salicylate synthase [Streptomyces sp. NPDC050636]|uniref:salicylate synthase n=1 Tax=Streptomyces sp. NPDC050636 TaxID=3154510 RepID=UPI003417971F
MPNRYHTMKAAAAGDRHAVAAQLAASQQFDSHVVYETPEGLSIALGTHSELRLNQRTARVVSGGEVTETEWHGDPLEPVRSFLRDVDLDDWRVYGWCAFELAYAISGNPAGSADASDQVLAHLMVPHTEVRLHDGYTLIRSLDPDALGAVADALSEPADLGGPTAPRADVDLEASAAEYSRAVLAAIEDINDGRLQKVVLSRLVPVAEELDFPATYVAGRRANTPARSFLLHLDGLRAVGFSPETVVEVTSEGQVTTQPLAGTRRRTGDAATDRQLREDLLSDAKELHEHAISVKVAVDELMGPCKPDTVVVQDYMRIAERGKVQHLASRVVGRLPEGGSSWDAFAAAFPAVTASGVPKHAAYDLIRRDEPVRGPYAGTVMTVDADGSMDAALVLRTVFSRDGETWLRAGAGVVGNSRPERELEETREKLRSVSGDLVRRVS